jgi:hypothetical protein
MSETEYQATHKQYTEYLLMKVKTRDWHGVADAAMDLRELEAFWRGLQK